MTITPNEEAYMSLLGPSRTEVWEQLSAEINAKMVEGGPWKGDRIEVTHGHWTLYLESDTVATGDSNLTYTRMRAPFVSTDDMKFKIYKSSIFTNIGRHLGMQDIKIGYDAFDEDVVVKGNNEALIIRLLDNPLIRSLIKRQPQLSLEIKSTEGSPDSDDQHELYFSYAGLISDTEVVKELFDLFMEVLDEMVRIGSALNKEPNIDLYEGTE